MQKGSRNSRRNCSVVGCNLTYINCPPGTKFFVFPNKKQHEIRRNAWIAALKRGTRDGKPWEPTNNSLVCSRHFVNGTPSRDPDSPGYVPRLFMKPLVSIERQQEEEHRVTSRYERRKRRHENENVKTNLAMSRVNKLATTDTCFERDCGVHVDLVDTKHTFHGYRFPLIMEKPVFIKCEPGTAEQNNTDPDMKLPPEEQTEVKTEPEDVDDNPFIEEEIEIQDMKIEAYDEENDANEVSSNENQILPPCPEVPQTTFNKNQRNDRSQCNTCGKWFSRGTSLRRHVVVHSGEKPYKCNKCGRSFAYVDTWKSHQSVHSGLKKHFCSTCGSGFRLQSALKRHMLSHSKVNIYKCTLCGTEFIHRRNFERHMLSHSQVENPILLICVE